MAELRQMILAAVERGDEQERRFLAYCARLKEADRVPELEGSFLRRMARKTKGHG